MKKIVEKNGRLTIDIDGKEIPTIAYMSYIPQNADYDGFHKIGYDLYSGCIYVSDNPINEYAGNPKCFEEGIWKNRNTFDFSSLDKVLKATLGEQPKGYLMLRININMPNWWREENLNELMQFEDGTTLMQSSFSQEWIEDIKVFFSRLKSYIDNSIYKEHVIAWQPAAMATEEWFSPTTWNENQPDFSLCAKIGFQKWCKQKYGNIDTLNGVWETRYGCFEDIEIPTAEKRVVRNRENIIANTGESIEVSDFYECLNNSYAQAIIQISRYIKELYNGDILVGTFYGYIGQLPCTSGHNALKKLFECADIDYFASPFAYVNQRQTAEDWIYHSAMETCRQIKRFGLWRQI